MKAFRFSLLLLVFLGGSILMLFFNNSFAEAQGTNNGSELTVEEKYKQAQIFLAENSFEAAAEIFEGIRGYEDSSQYAMYAKALLYAEKGEYDIAISALDTLGSFKDSAQQKIYYQGRSLEGQDNFYGLTEAKRIYEEIILFRDCLTRIDNIDRRIEEIYVNAIQLGEAGNYYEARLLLYEMQSYKEAASYALYYSTREREAKGGHIDNLYALRDYKKLDDFLDSRERFEGVADKFISEVKVGDTLYFGDSFFISWRVLDVDIASKRLLLITQNTISNGMTYGYGNTHTTWKDSQIRAWLNNSFYNGQFCEGEAAFIEEVTLEETVVTPGRTDNSFSIGYTGEKTTDRIFVLSTQEAYQYFDSPNDRAIAGGYDSWWLRDGGRLDSNIGSGFYVAAYVDEYGGIGTTFHNGAGGLALRPSLYLNLNWDGKGDSDFSSNQSVSTEEMLSITEVMDEINNIYGEKIWELTETRSTTLDDGKQAIQSATQYCFEHIKNKSGTYVGGIKIWQGDSNGLVTIQAYIKDDAKNYLELAYTYSSLLDKLYGVPRSETEHLIYAVCNDKASMPYALEDFAILENGLEIELFQDLGSIFMYVR